MKTIRSTLFLLLALNIIGVAGLWFGFVMMRDTKSKEASLREELLTENQKSEQTDKSKRVLLNTKKDREELSQFLYGTSDEDQIKFISDIEYMGTSTSGALVETLQLELTKTKPPVLRGEFTIKGTWGQLYHVLRLIEELPSRVNITRFEAKSGSGDQWLGAVKIDLVSLKETR